MKWHESKQKQDLWNMTEDEEDAYIETLSEKEKLILAKELIDYAQYCIDEMRGVAK